MIPAAAVCIADAVRALQWIEETQRSARSMNWDRVFGTLPTWARDAAFAAIEAEARSRIARELPSAGPDA